MNHYWRAQAYEEDAGNTWLKTSSTDHRAARVLSMAQPLDGSHDADHPKAEKTEGKVPSVSDPRALAHLLELILSTAQAGLAFSKDRFDIGRFRAPACRRRIHRQRPGGSVRTGRELDRPGQPLPAPETGRPCVDPRLATAGPAGPRGLGWSLDPTGRLVRRKRVAGRCGSSRNPGRERTGSPSDTPVGIAGQAQASPPSPTAACVESFLLLPRHRWQASATNGRNVGGRVLSGGRLAAAFRAPGTGLADPDVMAANPRRNARGAFRLGCRPHGVIARQTA